MTDHPSKKKNILVVDDDPVQVKLVVETLRGKGFDVLSAMEAPDGLQLALQRKPNLIILDVMMPIINGFNFCKLLKQEQSCKHIPIILVTSRDQKEDMEIGREMGADAYLTKPLNIAELLRTIEAIG